MFYALQERRDVSYRYDYLRTGMVVAALLNQYRRPTDPPISPYDFISTEDPEREQAKQNIASLFAMVGTGTPERFAELRRRAIDGLKRSGHTDATEIFEEVFTAWKDSSNGSDNRRNS